jgi:hypothetical protein
LTRAQYNEMFAPAPATYARTMALLERRGFRITQTFANRSMIGATASAGIAERYFSTQLHAVYQQKRGVRYANVTPAILPAELRDVAVSVSGLHSIVTVHFPIQFGNPSAIRHSAAYAAAAARVAAKRAASRKLGNAVAVRRSAPFVRRRLTAPPLGATTPAPGPDPTESPEDPDTDYLDYYGYGPPIFAEGYDYPLQHGYGGYGHSAASVIDVDYLDSDIATEAKTFNVNRTGTTSAKGYRECADPSGGALCDGTIGAGDSDGESTLDATAIMMEAPYADFYEYIAPAFDDLQIEAAYELAVSQDYVEAINSSFGGCETDDPSFEYATSYIAMEGASLGITFSASAGDTGAFSCGTYASNGVPQTELDISIPAGGTYFVGVGGTSYLQITPEATNDYQGEIVWQFGGGGASVIEPIPAWQQALVAQSSAAADVSTTFRNIPDVTMVADPGANPDGFVGGVAGAGLVICHNGSLTDSGGTSLASPMWIAMQTDINEVQHSRNGFVNPSLYAIAATSSAEYTFAFNDITLGENTFYTAETGYDDASGIGSPVGFDLAGAPEYGVPGATAAPIRSPAPSPSPPLGPSPIPSPVPSASPSPHASGPDFVVTTIAGSSCETSDTSLDGTGNAACFANPTGITYVPVASVTNAEVGQSSTDAYLFVNDFYTGFLRGMDLTSAVVTTENDEAWNNGTRAKNGGSPSELYGLTYFTGAGVNGATFGGLYLLSAGDESFVQIKLPTTPNADATAPTSTLKALSGGTAAAVFDTVGSDAGLVDSTDDVLHVGVFGAAIDDDTTGSTGLPPKGNFGITLDGATPANYVITDSGLDEILAATDVPESSTVSVLSTSTLLNDPKQIVYVSSLSAFFVANCGGNNILRLAVTTSAGTDTIGAVTVAAGDGAARETDGKNTGAEFNCPFGITTDAATPPNLYVTDAGGNTIRKISTLI